MSTIQIKPIRADNTIIVPDDYPTIQAAINAASNGSSIYVRSGTYHENVVVNKTVSLVGENRSTTIIDGNYTGNDMMYHTMNITASNVKITAFTIQSSKLQAGIGVYVSRPSTHNNISYNIITNNDYGIYLDVSSNNTISGNNITDNLNGIELSNSHDNTLNDNRVTENDFGIHLWLSWHNTLRNNDMSGNCYNFLVTWAYPNDIDSSNTVDGKPIYYLVNTRDRTVPLDAGCVVLINSTNITVKDLNLKNNYRGILLTSTTNSTIIGNTITDNGDGIYLEESSGNYISGNNITRNYNHAGIALAWSSYNTISGNEITNNTIGISLYDNSNNNWVSENDITSNKRGIHLEHSNDNTFSENDITSNKRGLYLTFMPSGNRFYHNNFENNTQNVESWEPDYTNFWDNGVEGNYWSDYKDRYPEAKELDDSGIWDTPYVIDENNQDNYPLVNPITHIDHPISIEVVEIESEPWNALNVPFEDVDEATEYIENFELSPIPEDFGKIPVTVTIVNTGYSSATGVSIDARMTGDILMVVLDPDDISNDRVVSYHFDYTETVFTDGTIGAGDKITEELMLPIKYCSLVVGGISLPDPDTNELIPLDIIVPMISVHVTLTIKGNFDDAEYEIPEDILGIGDPIDLLKKWNTQLSQRVQEKEVRVFLETYYSHVLNLKPLVIDINPNIPTGVYETQVNILPGTSKITLTLTIPAVTITLVGFALLPWGATTPIGGTLIAVGLAMIVLNNPPPGTGNVTIETASPELNMTLEVVQLIPKNIQTIDHVVVEDGQTFHVITVCNSTLTDFDFNKEEKQISFNINSTSENHIFCHVTIPKKLLRDNATHPWKVKLNDAEIGFIPTENETHSFIYFNVIDTGTHAIEIVGAEVISELDITPPTIFILSPENKTYPENDVPLTFTVSESTSWIGYSLDSQMNVTISGNTTLAGLSDGSHSLVVYANDTAGNTGASEIIYFTIETQPEPQPAEPFPTWIVAVIVIVVIALVAVLVRTYRKRKP